MTPGLPEEPDEPNVVAVSDYGKTLTVEWSPPAADTLAAGHVTYVLQERHHVGAEYVAERMAAWATVTRTDRTQEQLKQLHAPGRWFQFRVAAINGNGTRGYSPASRPFFVKLGPRECHISHVTRRIRSSCTRVTKTNHFPPQKRSLFRTGVIAFVRPGWACLIIT